MHGIRRKILVIFFEFLFLVADIQAAYFSQFSMREPDHDPCYDTTGRPVRCVPDFINAAFGKPVIASSTCGLNGPTKWVIKNVIKIFACGLTENLNLLKKVRREVRGK